MPSTLAPDRLGASSRRALSREARPPCVGEVTLSQELRTARLPRPHVLVGYQWSHTGLRPGRKTSHNRSIRSFVSHLPQIRTCTSKTHPVRHVVAPLSLTRSGGFAGTRLRGTMSSAWFQPPVHDAAPPSLHGVREGPFPRFFTTMGHCDSLSSISPRFVSFAWRYHRCVPCSSPAAQDLAGDQPGVFNPVLQPAVTMETARSPKFPGNPNDHSPCSADPGVTRQA